MKTACRKGIDVLFECPDFIKNSLGRSVPSAENFALGFRWIKQ